MKIYKPRKPKFIALSYDPPIYFLPREHFNAGVYDGVAYIAEVSDYAQKLRDYKKLLGVEWAKRNPDAAKRIAKKKYQNYDRNHGILRKKKPKTRRKPKKKDSLWE